MLIYLISNVQNHTKTGLNQTIVEDDVCIAAGKSPTKKNDQNNFVNIKSLAILAFNNFDCDPWLCQGL